MDNKLIKETNPCARFPDGISRLTVVEISPIAAFVVVKAPKVSGY